MCLEIGLFWSVDEFEMCFSEGVDLYELIVLFVVFEDVMGFFWVDVCFYGVGVLFLRFMFEF